MPSPTLSGDEDVITTLYYRGIKLASTSDTVTLSANVLTIFVCNDAFCRDVFLLGC